MKLKDKIKAKLPPLPGGTYPAICIGVADVGDQFYQQYENTSRKVAFTFEIPSEADGSGNPRQLTKYYTFSDSKKSKMRPLLNSWTNKNMSEQEMREFDLFSLIGSSCLINISITKDRQYNDIEAVMSLPKGIPPLQSATPAIRYDMDVDGFEGEVWDGLPNWVKEKIQKSKQYQELAPDTVLSAPPDEEKTVDTAAPLTQEPEPIRASQTTREKAPMSSSNTTENVDLEGDCPF